MKAPVPKTLLNRINITAYWEDYQLNEALGSNYDSFQKQFEGVWGGGSGATPGRLCDFYPSFKQNSQHLNCHQIIR